MMHNDVLRRIRYIFDFDDFQMMDVFAQAGHTVSREQVCAWLKPDHDAVFEKIPDRWMAVFLNGLINLKRGRRDGEQPEPEKVLTNNMVLMKLRIALNLQSDDVLLLLRDTGLEFSKHELTALFRKPGHKHYRPCEDQILRNVLKGLQLKMRDAEKRSEADSAEPASGKPGTRTKKAVVADKKNRSVWGEKTK